MSGKHMGIGSQGKGSGTGANTVMPEDMVGENQILSNRDKAQHSKERGLDGKQVLNDQHREHAASHLPDDER